MVLLSRSFKKICASIVAAVFLVAGISSASVAQTTRSDVLAGDGALSWLKSIRWASTGSRFYLDVGASNLAAPITYGLASALLQISQLMWSMMTIISLVVYQVMSVTDSILPMLVNGITSVLIDVVLGPLGILIGIGLVAAAYRSRYGQVSIVPRMAAVVLAAATLITVGDATRDAQIAAGNTTRNGIIVNNFDYPATSAGGLTEAILALQNRLQIVSSASLLSPSVSESSDKSSCVTFEAEMVRRHASQTNQAAAADMAVYDAVYEAAFLDVSSAAAFGSGVSADHIRCIAWERSRGATEAELVQSFKELGMLPESADPGVFSWSDANAYNRTMAFAASCSWSGSSWSVREGWINAWMSPEGDYPKGQITAEACKKAAEAGNTETCGESKAANLAEEVGGFLTGQSIFGSADAGTCGTKLNSGPWHWGTLGSIESDNTQAPEVRETMFSVTGNSGSTAIGLSFFSILIGVWTFVALGLSRLASMIALIGLAFSIPLGVVPLVRICLGAEDGLTQLKQWFMGVVNLLIISILVGFAPVIWSQVAVFSIEAAALTVQSSPGNVVSSFGPTYELVVMFIFLWTFSITLLWTAWKAKKMGTGGSLVAKAMNPIGAVSAATQASFAAGASGVDPDRGRRTGRLARQFLAEGASDYLGRAGFGEAAGLIGGTSGSEKAKKTFDALRERTGRDGKRLLGRGDGKGSTLSSPNSASVEMESVRPKAGRGGELARRFTDDAKRQAKTQLSKKRKAVRKVDNLTMRATEAHASEALFKDEYALSRLSELELAEARKVVLDDKRKGFSSTDAADGLTPGTTEYSRADREYRSDVQSQWDALGGDSDAQNAWIAEQTVDLASLRQAELEESQFALEEVNARGVGLNVHGQDYLDVESAELSASRKADTLRSVNLPSDVSAEQLSDHQAALQAAQEESEGLLRRKREMESRSGYLADSQYQANGPLRSDYPHRVTPVEGPFPPAPPTPPTVKDPRIAEPIRGVDSDVDWLDSPAQSVTDKGTNTLPPRRERTVKPGPSLARSDRDDQAQARSEKLDRIRSKNKPHLHPSNNPRADLGDEASQAQARSEKLDRIRNKNKPPTEPETKPKDASPPETRPNRDRQSGRED